MNSLKFRHYTCLLFLLAILTGCAKISMVQLVLMPENGIKPDSETFAALKNQLEKRLSDEGFQDAKVSMDETGNKVLVSAGVNIENEELMKKYRGLFSSTRLEFWDTYSQNDPEVTGFLADLPAITGFIPETSGGAFSNLGYCEEEDRLSAISDSLDHLAPKPAHLKLMWSAFKEIRNMVGPQPFVLYMIDTRGLDEAPLSGANLTKAEAQPDQYTGKVSVVLGFDGPGAKTWADMTRKAAMENHRQIAMVINGRVFSAPMVMTEIKGGVSSISGDFTQEEAMELAKNIRWGELIVPLSIVDESVLDQ